MSQISVAEYYAGKSILVTGATGFMGKVLVEKLLRCCPELKTMYVMVREKKGKNAESRLNALMENQVFEKLLEQYPKAFNKVKLICGDTLAEGLGMSISDVEELERECQIVFNNAACVKFDLPLREAVKVNTVGLLRMLKLAEGMKKLEAFVHISTAFCHDELEVLEEKMYPSKHNPLDVIDSLKWMDDEMLNASQAT
ncbi:fatty acyl-CoA reductase 2-like [Melitaea cinxia]|uniref:fatty acyl-CoA reductase 2-like n=1 Tax=Melitaea cinxia TaxID=113334 RepID=UPI001E26F60C|nr:fatty acyl-CoA reductase 2-like [Melitaea cinxia]